MGYRRLLKNFLKELRANAGGDFVEELIACGDLHPRDAGELRSIVAELNRESFRESAPQELSAAGLTLLAQRSGIGIDDLLKMLHDEVYTLDEFTKSGLPPSVPPWVFALLFTAIARRS